MVRRGVIASCCAGQEAVLLDIVDSPTPVVTRTERDVHCRHDCLGAALDVINNYQRTAQSRHFFVRMDEARLRLVEVLKHWIRSYAGRDRVDEDTIRNMSKLIADVLREPELFASRQTDSLASALTRVYDQLQNQLNEGTAKDRPSARLMDDVMVHAKGLLSSTIVVLLLGPTHLVEMDHLPSLAPDVLRESISGDMKSVMATAWATDCGRLAAAILSMRLFTGKPSDKAHEDFKQTMLEIQPGFEGHGGEMLQNSGLAGPFRNKDKSHMRILLLAVFRTSFELSYLFGDVLMPFQSNIQDYGDYGAIRSARLLHPVISTLLEKAHRLRTDLLKLYYGEIEETLIRQAHRNGEKLEKPCGTSKMAKLGHEKMEEATSGQGSLVCRLEQSLVRLKEQSHDDRLTVLEARLADAGEQLALAFQSTHCRECVCMEDGPAGKSMRDLMNKDSNEWADGRGGLRTLAIETALQGEVVSLERAKNKSKSPTGSAEYAKLASTELDRPDSQRPIPTAGGKLLSKWSWLTSGWPRSQDAASDVNSTYK